MRKLFIFSTVWLALGCDSNDNTLGCIRGKITGGEMCSTFLILEVQGSFIGKDVDYDGKHYKNAIRVLGDQGSVNSRYFRLREYDEKTDAERA